MGRAGGHDPDMYLKEYLLAKMGISIPDGDFPVIPELMPNISK